MSSARLALAALAAPLLCALAAAGCELPQDKKGNPTDASEDGADTKGGAPRDFRLLRIVDLGGTTDEAAPGADIDAIVVFRDEVFLAAGCTQATLFGADLDLHGGNPLLDPAGATLTVREQSTKGGFVSLGKGTLLCELPVLVRTGDVIAVWEAEGDGRDRWRAGVAASADDSFETIGDFEGTASFVVP